MKCRDAGVYPKFVCYKHLKNKPYKVKNRYYRRILLDEITTKNRSICNFKNQLYEAQTALHESTTGLKRLCNTYTLINVANKEARKLKTSIEKKFSKTLKDAKYSDGIYPNSSVPITNLCSRALTNDEYETLQYGLKHGIAIKPKDNEISAIAEDIYDQIDKKGLCKENQISIQRLKNSLQAFTFNILDVDDKKVYSDFKKLKVIKNLWKDVAILKPDKGNGALLINNVHYYQSIEHLFIDKKKFKQIDKDSTIPQHSILQNYLR